MNVAKIHHHLAAAIVDLDGTLVDTLGDFDASLNAMLADLRQPSVGRSFIEHTVGKGSEHLIRQTLAHVGASEGLYEAELHRLRGELLLRAGGPAATEQAAASFDRARSPS